MGESITTRVGRIISGSVNTLVDAMENAAPEVVMEQLIREVEGATDEVRAELGKIIAGKHLANNRLMEENRKHEEFSAQIQVAINESRDDLAEAAVSKQMDIEAQIPVLESSIFHAVEKEKELEGYIKALNAKKREMQEELKLFRESNLSATQAVTTAGSSSSIAGNVDRASSAFDRVMAANANLPAGSRVADPATTAKLVELEDLARNNRIKERLAAAKAASDTQ